MRAARASSAFFWRPYGAIHSCRSGTASAGGINTCLNGATVVFHYRTSGRFGRLLCQAR